MDRADMFSLKLVYDMKTIIKSRGLEEQGRVQQFIDSEVLRLCAPMVPKDTNALIESGTNNTQIGSGEIRYRTPYARKWYYMPAKFNEAPQRGNYFFERMKQQHLQQLLRGAKQISGAK